MVSLIDRASSAWRSFVYGELNHGMQQRDAAGGLVLGGTRSTAVWPSYELDGQVARAFRLAVVQACIDAIARDVSAAPLRVYREVDGQPEVQPTHPSRIVVGDPNPAMSETEFWHFVVSMMAVTGFCVVEKVRSGAGRPVELWPLVSPWLKVKPQSQAMPDWEYRVPGNDPWPLAAEDVIVITYRPDPWGGWTGRTPLTSLKRELAIDDQMTDFLNMLLERGGVPPLGLKARPQGESKTIPKFTPEEAEMYRQQFAEKYGGVGNWGKPVWLGGFEVERIGLDLGEMLFPQVREHIELHICTAFGVPAGMIGTAAGLARNTYSNAETDVRKYYDGTIAPLWARLDGAFTRGLLREFDLNGNVSMGFDTADIAALQEDEAPKWDQATRGLGAGLLTLDDARSHIGLASLPNGAGDVLYLPFSVVVIKPADLLKEAEPQPVPAALQPAAEGDPASSPDPEATDDAAAQRMVRLSTRQRDALHTRANTAVTHLTRRGAPMLRAFWKQQGQRITEAATRSWAGANTRDLTEIDWDFEEQELAKVLNRFYVLNGETAFAHVADLLKIGLTWDVGNPNVKRVMDQLGLRIVGISDTTRKDVQRTVANALDEGVAMPELSERLSHLFEETYKGRAMTVARTESFQAYSRASLLGYEESGKIAYVEILDNPDHKETYGALDGLSCAGRNGLVVPIAQTQLHIDSEHINGTMAIAPVLARPLGE